MKIEFGYKKGFEGYQAYFTIDNQTFHLDECVEDTEEDSLELAKWCQRQLQIAFEKLKAQTAEGGQSDLLVRQFLPDKYILDACCGGRMFWYDKNHDKVLYADKRNVDKGAFANNWNPNWCVKPDITMDFRAMPFKDNSFKMVVYDPPHLTSGSEKSVINKKYGLLNKETWKQDLIDGFNECWRVLDEYGTLIFKWNEANIKASELIKALPVAPLFGDFTGKTGKTIWMTFMKLPENDRQKSA